LAGASFLVRLREAVLIGKLASQEKLALKAEVFEFFATCCQFLTSCVSGQFTGASCSNGPRRTLGYIRDRANSFMILAELALVPASSNLEYGFHFLEMFLSICSGSIDQGTVGSVFHLHESSDVLDSCH
jgi:hypothetical protein